MTVRSSLAGFAGQGSALNGRQIVAGDAALNGLAERPGGLASLDAGVEKAVMVRVTVASWCWPMMKASSPRS
jgi:hypothetical protein